MEYDDAPVITGQPVSAGYSVKYQIPAGYNLWQTNGQYQPPTLKDSQGPFMTAEGETTRSASPAKTHQPLSAKSPVEIQQPAPPELEVFRNVSRVIIKRKMEHLEIFNQWHAGKRYSLHNDLGQLMFYALEDLSSTPSCYFAGNLPMLIRILDKNGIQVALLKSKNGCCSSAPRVALELPPGRYFADYQLHFGSRMLSPAFYLCNAAGELMYKLKSPLTAAFGSFGNLDFEIVARDQKTVVGHIGKDRSERMISETPKTADVFNVFLPLDLDAKWKLALMASPFAMNYLFYDQDNLSFKTRLGL